MCTSGVNTGNEQGNSVYLFFILLCFCTKENKNVVIDKYSFAFCS